MRPGDIRIRKGSIAKLLHDVDAGRFAIPHLQREFVWDGPKAAKLLDSILRAMPVGVPDHRVDSAVTVVRLIERYDALVAKRRENGVVRSDWSEVLSQLIGTSGAVRGGEGKNGAGRET